jgi:hypothetical protein
MCSSSVYASGIRNKKRNRTLIESGVEPGFGCKRVWHYARPGPLPGFGPGFGVPGVKPGFVVPGFADPGLVEAGFVEPGFVEPGFVEPGVVGFGFVVPGAVGIVFGVVPGVVLSGVVVGG